MAGGRARAPGGRTPTSLSGPDLRDKWPGHQGFGPSLGDLLPSLVL